MKRLFMKVTMIVTGVLLLFIPVNNFVKNSYDYNISHEIQGFKKNPISIDIVNLGASHSMYGYYFKPTGLAHLDLALPGQTFEYDLKLIKEYGKYLKPNGIVLISISQISFVDSEVDSIGKYYRILDRNDIDPFHLVDYYSYMYVPGTNSGIFTSALSRKWKTFKWNAHQTWANNGKNYSKRKFEMVQEQYRQASETNNIKQSVEKLVDIVEYCKDKGYQVVLTMEPVHQSYQEYFNEEVMDQLVFQYLKPHELDVPFLNYMRDERFSTNKNYYLDPDHLNSDGRKKLSWIVYKDLKDLGYL
ncbi:hypothetical protein [Mangrovibacillus cuniculi]|uniref:SGNH/GDSL hydrolase family protein n=1 Tax=Mangrovibacillus cuniculi TaxID=2593652 RepID=A0A7S8HEI0_9BACI|nr:hypothetical protein [Mangrovibacillus cuniculi]QPC45516.1 hypothetical protein G8O30_00255 [Mangrovibacillus cuniculi]